MDMFENKKSIVINFTNHPSKLWDAAQKEAASKYGEIVDVPFPQVNENANSEEVIQLAQKYVDKIIEMNPAMVVCQGEFCLTYYVVKQLKENSIKVMAACSKRETYEIQNDDGSVVKTAVFKFVQFREYA